MKVRGVIHPETPIDGYSRLAYTEALPDEKAVKEEFSSVSNVLTSHT